MDVFSGMHVARNQSSDAKSFVWYTLSLPVWTLVQATAIQNRSESQLPAGPFKSTQVNLLTPDFKGTLLSNRASTTIQKFHVHGTILHHLQVLLWCLHSKYADKPKTLPNYQPSLPFSGVFIQQTRNTSEDFLVTVLVARARLRNARACAQ